MMMNHSAGNDSSHQEQMLEEQNTPAQIEFFKLLHKMISNESYTGVVQWASDNKGFLIHNKQVFCDYVLSRYFGKAKYTSFTRRLKRWGFRRATSGVDVGAYYHELFHRNMAFDSYGDDADVAGPPSMPGENSMLYASNQACMNDFSSVALPLKKRSKQTWSPEPPSYYEHQEPMASPMLSSPRAYAASHNFLQNDVGSSQMADVRTMPEIMRVINHQKRRERKEDLQSPTSKRMKLHRDHLYSETFPSINSDVRETSQEYEPFYDRSFASRHGMPSMHSAQSASTSLSSMTPFCSSMEYLANMSEMRLRRQERLMNYCSNVTRDEFQSNHSRHLMHRPETNNNRTGTHYEARPLSVQGNSYNDHEKDSTYKSAVPSQFGSVRLDGSHWRVPIPDLQEPKKFPFNRAA